MIMQRFGLFFYLKKPKGYSSGDRPIYLRITVDGIVTELSIQRACDPALWNIKTYRANGKREEIRALNAYLDTLQAKVFEAKHQLIQSCKPVTSGNVKSQVLGREIGSKERPRMIMVMAFGLNILLYFSYDRTMELSLGHTFFDSSFAIKYHYNDLILVGINLAPLLIFILLERVRKDVDISKEVSKF